MATNNIYLDIANRTGGDIYQPHFIIISFKTGFIIAPIIPDDIPHIPRANPRRLLNQFFISIGAGTKARNAPAKP